MDSKAKFELSQEADSSVQHLRFNQNDLAFAEADRRAVYRERLFVGVLQWSVWIALAVLAIVIIFLIREAWPAWQRLGFKRFVFDEAWYPLSGQFNVVPMWLATFMTSLLAIMFAVPIGVGTAVLLACYLPPSWSTGIERLLYLLAAIPSVCFGLWGLSVLAPLVATLGGSGQSWLSAGLVLAFMVLPTIALTSTVSLRAVPAAWLDGGAALGLSRAQVTLSLALPTAAPGIGIGALVAFCRAIGETMAVVMVAGNVPTFNWSPLAPVRTTTANLALELGYATAEHRSVLYATAVMLLLAVVALSALGRLRRTPDES